MIITQPITARPASWASFGIDLPQHATGSVRTICPKCSASRRKALDRCLSLDIDKGVWYCWHCGWRGRLHGQHHTRQETAVACPPLQPDARKRGVLNRVWGETYPLRPNDPVYTYLRQRGITLALDGLPQVLRYHPHLYYRDDSGKASYFPAMIALVYGPDGHPASLHRTYLTANGRKASVLCPKKLMPGAAPGATRGGAIHLYPASSVLGVAEGIETALAVHVATGMPVWSAICARGMAALVLPSEVQLVVIFADNDPPGIAAAKALAHRVLGEGRRAKILTPSVAGADWADMAGEVGYGA
jgi:putative DNA primase/helicase